MHIEQLYATTDFILSEADTDVPDITKEEYDLRILLGRIASALERTADVAECSHWFAALSGDRIGGRAGLGFGLLIVVNSDRCPTAKCPNCASWRSQDGDEHESGIKIGFADFYSNLVIYKSRL